MMQILCGENFLEYTGSGWFQCGRHVNCPKRINNKILGFDCLLYVDSLPEGCKMNISDDNLIKIDIVSRSIDEKIVSGNDHIVSHKKGPVIQIIPASEQIVHGTRE